MRHNPEKYLGKILDDEETSSKQSANVTNIAYHARVIGNEDPKNSKRVKARIEGIDDGVSDTNLPWCVSLMPNFFFYLPQPDEHVIVMLTNPWNKNFTRFYMGPVQSGNFGEQVYDETMEAFGFVSNENKKQ